MEKIEPTWLAYALDAPAGTETVRRHSTGSRGTTQSWWTIRRSGTGALGLAVDSR